MYPNLYYAFKDLFGVEWPFLRIVNSFGFFVALSFMLAAWILTSELKRKSKEGLLKASIMEVTVGKPAGAGELIINFILGFLFGYKILGLLFMQNSATIDPQEFIFSGIGSWPAGLALGALFTFLKWREKNKQKLEKPVNKQVRIWPHDRVGEIVVLALIFGLVGAKLFDIFENWSDFLTRPADYIFSAGGLTFYGGLICAALAIWYYAKKHQIGIWHLNDAAAPALMLSYATGRIGCQVSGDGDWGIENPAANPYSWLPDWMWSYTYPHNVNDVGIPIEGCTGKYCHVLPVPVYPTPLYETIAGILLFAVLWGIRKKLSIPGLLFAIYLMMNGIERFLIEKIRVNERLDIGGFQPTQAEVISTSLFIGGLVLAIYLVKKNKKTIISEV